MSWSGSGFMDDGEIELSLPGELSKESMEQAQAGSRAIQSIVKTGCLGDPLGYYNVAVTGHANIGHEPTAGWANDSINISISQSEKVEQ